MKKAMINQVKSTENVKDENLYYEIKKAYKEIPAKKHNNFDKLIKQLT